MKQQTLNSITRARNAGSRAIGGELYYVHWKYGGEGWIGSEWYAAELLVKGRLLTKGNVKGVVVWCILATTPRGIYHAGAQEFEGDVWHIKLAREL